MEKYQTPSEWYNWN